MRGADTNTEKRRGTMAYMASSGVQMVGALVRYTILARMLGAEQLGLAASMMLTTQFLSSMTDNGSDRFLIQDQRGDDPAVQKLVQFTYIMRGFLLGVVFLLAAVPAAAFFHEPDLKQGLVMMSIPVIIGGFLHLDVSRSQRRQDFRIEGWMGILAEVVSLAATLIAAFLIHSFIAVVYGAIARSVTMVVVTHTMATRRYEVGWSREYAGRLARFAAPLMLNGLLLFLSSQSDRALVGHKLGIVELGRYTAVMLLCYYPASMIMRFMGALHLPLVSAARVDEAARRRAEDTLAGQTTLLGVLIMCGFAAVGPLATVILYGPEFRHAPLIVGLIGIMQAMRFVRQWPTTVALSLGRGDIVLLNNMVRMVGWLGLLLPGGLAGVLLSFAAGDLLAMVTSLLMLNRANGDPRFLHFDRLAILTLVSACVVAWVLVAEHHHILLGLGAAAATLAVGRWVFLRERTTIDDSLRLARMTVGRLAKA